MNDSNNSKLKAPYASIKPFSGILSKIREYQLKKISTDTLIKWGYKQFDASSSVSALKFLNLIDDEDNTTADYSSIRSDAKYKQELKRIVEQAYNRLFDLYAGDISSKTRKDIEDSIILDEAYPDTAKQTAGKAANLFIWLCNEAGIEVSEKAVTNSSDKTAGGKESSKNKQLFETKKPSDSATNYLSSTRINLNLNIDSSMSEDDIYRLLVNTTSAIKRIENDKPQR